MLTKDFHELARVSDRLSFLYVEHCRVEQDEKAIAIYDAEGITPVPCATLAVLMLGPGTAITHAAVLALADNGCLVVWCGEQGVRFYASGQGITRNSNNLLLQARLASRQSTRLKVVRQLYAMRFAEPLDPDLTLQQIRGTEGVRVRDAYARASRETGVPWKGRSYNPGQWKEADPINRALSTANACLYGLCHAAIVAAGYSPGIGFIHTGKQLSFVYDIADLYKAETTVPLAFESVAGSTKNLEVEVRKRCRDAFFKVRLLSRIVDDIETALDVPPEPDDESLEDFDADPARPGGLWDPETGEVPGGVSYGVNDEGTEEILPP